MRILLSAAAMAAFLSSPALAAFDLQITEMFPGIESPADENLSEDWFEVTNFGDMPWVAMTDGDLYFDDDSADPNSADIMLDIASIAPGESVIFVDGDVPNKLNVVNWTNLWTTPLTNAGRSVPQVGSYNGSGMSDSSEDGDGATIFLDPVGNGDPNDLVLLDAETYPQANANPNNVGKTYDSQFGVFTPTGGGQGIATIVTTTDIPGIPQKGSPGYLIPEPTTLTLLSVCLAVAGIRRRK